MSITLTCTVTGKTVKWSNQKIIDAKIAEYGSLEAFRAQYVSKGATKKTSTTPTTKAKSQLSVPRDGEVGAMKAIMNDGLKLGKMTSKDYYDMYEKKIADARAAGMSEREVAWLQQRLERWRTS
jgi:hypothetical protein